MSDKLYYTLVALLTAAAVFICGWLAGTGYTLDTLKVWDEPDIGKIAVMDYFGSISWHYGDWERSVEEIAALTAQ